MQEACDILNKNCIAKKRHLIYRNQWSIDNLTIGKSGCYRKKIGGNEIWITCQNCYETICNPQFVKKIYGYSEDRELIPINEIENKIRSELPKYPPYNKQSPDSGLLDVRLITNDKFNELISKYTHDAVFSYELYLASRSDDNNGVK